MESCWKYGGREYSFDISESRCFRSLSEALTVVKGLYEGDECHTVSGDVLIDRQCGIINRFFTALFGVEQAKLICGERQSLEAHTRAYVDFILFVNAQLRGLSEFREKVELRIAEQMGERIENLAGMTVGG